MRPVGMIAGLSLALTTLACGKKREAPPPPATAAPPVAEAPVAPRPLAVLPTTVALDQLDAHAPTVTGLRMTSPLAVDGSGKQALGAGCLPSPSVKVAMHQVADAFGVARWLLKVRETTKGDARGEFIADFELGDGTLHVRGVLAARPSCAAGEVGLDLYYSKLAPVPKVVAPPPAPPAPSSRTP